MRRLPMRMQAKPIEVLLAPERIVKGPFANLHGAEQTAQRSVGIKLSAIFDCAVAAQITVTYLQGFYRVVRVLHDRRQMEQQIETLLRGLGL